MHKVYMMRGIYTSASGMQAQKMLQENLANNLANVNTAGYKSSTFKQMIANQTKINENDKDLGSYSMGVEMFDTDYDYAQGPLMHTGNPLDISISGEGFFAFQDENARIVYSRDGKLNVDPDGYLSNTRGDFLLDEGFAPVLIGAQFSDQVGDGIRILRDGSVIVNDAFNSSIRPFKFVENTPVERIDANRFYVPEGTANVVTQVKKAVIRQGYLEKSNVNAIKASTELIQINRNYEANQRAITLQAETMSSLMDISGL